MRELSEKYMVSYSLLNEKKKNKFIQKRNVCFSELYSSKITKKDTLILRCFLTKETKMYSRIYLKRLAKICNVKIKFNNENEIELTGFENKFLVKVYTTLFRILFEVYSSYSQEGIEIGSKNSINFFKNYIKGRNNSGHKDMLSRLIYYYKKNNCFHGPGHGISSHTSQIIPIKTIKELQEWNVLEYADMQDFFKK